MSNSLRYIAAHPSSSSSPEYGNSFLKHSFSGRPMVEAQASSLNCGKPKSFRVCCIVATMVFLVSPIVPS